MLRLGRVVALVAAAILCAAVSNRAGPRERRLDWVGRYPDALHVPPMPSPTAAVSKPAAADEAQPAAAGAADHPPHPDRAWVDIGGDEATRLHARGVPFLDARRTAAYVAGHVAGARSFPIWESSVDAAIQRLFEEGRGVDAPLVVYCSGGDCEDSHMLAERLHQFGFDNALVYKDGFPDWTRRGLPVETGPER
jgi:rhodanese-related sulfurtransferase